MSIFLFFTRKLANVDKFCVDVLQGYVFMATVGLNAWNKLLYNWEIAFSTELFHS